MIDISENNLILPIVGIVGCKVKVQDATLDELIDQYEKLIGEVVFYRYPDETNGPRYLKSLLQWLRSTDFYRAPASTRYHEAYTGGLLVHTLNVYNNILELIKIPQFNSVDIHSAALVALTHDWCKIDYYESYEKNVKNETTSQWEKQLAFRTNQRGISLGHGVSSMFLVEKFFRLTPGEALAIRWHMGVFRVCNDEINELQQSNERYPLVHLLQFADQLSITEYANQTLQLS